MPKGMRTNGRPGVDRLGLIGVGTVLLGLCMAASRPQQPTFRAGTLVVSVDVSVQKGNQPVPGLAASDFVLYDNNTRQTIDSVSIGAVPVDVTFFLGTNNQSASADLTNLNGDIRAIAASLRPTDRMRLLTLGNEVTDVFGWRAGGASPASINVQVGGVQTLYDALVLAMLHRPVPGRRHVVIAMTDGIEFGSVVDSTKVRDVARRAESVLHLVFVEPPAPSAPNLNPDTANANALNLIPRGAFESNGFAFLRASWFHVMPDEQGLERLEEAARLTGGTVRHVASGKSIVESFTSAFTDFRQSYLIQYTPKGVSPIGWHDLRVEMAHGESYTIRARKGYFGG